MKGITWSEAARADLLDIVDYIADDNPMAAQSLLDDIQTKASGLSGFPLLGRPGRVEGTRELIVSANYIVVYCEQAIDLRVLRVLHAAQQWP